MNTLQLNGKTYLEKIKPGQHKDLQRPNLPYYILEGRIVQIPRTSSRLANVDIIEEFEKIQNKTSQLSFKKREEVEKIFYDYFIEVTPPTE